MRERADDELRELPLNQWSFVDARSIRLREGTQARPGFLYEFHYEAKNPKVQGLGFAATRDVVSWLRHSPEAVKATGRPMTHALAIGFSQAGRYLRNHISEGFNRDEQGRRVFDGILSHRPYSTTGGQVASLPCSERTVPQPFSKLAVVARTASRRFQHLALDVIGLLRCITAFGEASRSLAGPPKRQQEQEHGEDDGAVAQRRPRPRAGGPPGQKGGDHRRPRRQSSRRA